MFDNSYWMSPVGGGVAIEIKNCGSKTSQRFSQLERFNYPGFCFSQLPNIWKFWRDKRCPKWQFKFEVNQVGGKKIDRFGKRRILIYFHYKSWNMNYIYSTSHARAESWNLITSTLCRSLSFICNKNQNHKNNEQ